MLRVLKRVSVSKQQQVVVWVSTRVGVHGVYGVVSKQPAYAQKGLVPIGTRPFVTRLSLDQLSERQIATAQGTGPRLHPIAD